MPQSFYARLFGGIFNAILFFMIALIVIIATNQDARLYLSDIIKPNPCAVVSDNNRVQCSLIALAKIKSDMEYKANKVIIDTIISTINTKPIDNSEKYTFGNGLDYKYQEPDN